LTWEVL